MIGGVNFQPGGGDPNQQQRSPGAGVQEAIKVLSLRLPKVVGAQAAVPMPLLTSQGSGGNRVDSVVNQILARIMPTGQPQSQPMATMAPQQPQAPQGAPSFSGSATPQYTPPQRPAGPPALPAWPWGGQMPRVIIGGPPTTGTDAQLSGGFGPPSGTDTPSAPPGMIGTLPPNWEDLMRSLGGGGGSAPSEPETLF